MATSEAPERVQGEYGHSRTTLRHLGPTDSGRVFTADEDTPGRGHVVVISERMWRTRFQADSALVGQSIRLNGAPYTVIGVMPKTFDPLLDDSDLWIPEAFTPRNSPITTTII